ncbi:MAG TPA: UDP-N-acetylglucosamine 2-epimerase (non-hydrolyzing) [Rhizobiaceae bacterium]|nr:UDP-N-acetylglucosamine 2-epimerase (non-hydrolyzing) [Rhizobiaceae bacterium]
MLKIMTIVGTRPEVIRLSRIIPKLDQNFDHRLVHTGQNGDYELNAIFFEQLGIRAPDINLEAARPTPAETIGHTIMAVDRELDTFRPDAVLILGDTNSSLAAISAKRRGITIFHMEAGNRCFDMRVPEEINRRIVDHISDYNLPYSAIAREYLLREGLPANKIIKTGSPMREVLDHYREEIEASTIIDRLELTQSGYYVLSVHRQENVDTPERIRKLFEVIDAVGQRKAPIVVSTHPRTRQRIESFGLTLPRAAQFHKPFGFLDYIKLQCAARAVLSDSGTITEEASILGFPALNLRDTHERPEGMEQAVVMMVGLEADRVLLGLDILERAETFRLQTGAVDDYADTNISDKIVRIIASHAGSGACN